MRREGGMVCSYTRMRLRVVRFRAVLSEDNRTIPPSSICGHLSILSFCSETRVLAINPSIMS